MDTKTPACIGIILDGNRRWARAQGLPQLVGHQKGFEKFIEAARWVREAGVSHLAVYAFSTENWNRKAEEVSYLMEIFRKMAAQSLQDLTKEGVRVRFLGQRERFAEDIQKHMADAEAMSPKDASFTVWVCLSYGGRAEIIEAAKKMQQSGMEITESSLRGAMWSADMPDPDIIIRTSGEQRLSGFLTWASVYSELFFLDVHWPGFTKDDLARVLAEYAERERRHGK
jgi:undecaprenyl diphosphate synthase